MSRCTRWLVCPAPPRLPERETDTSHQPARPYDAMLLQSGGSCPQRGGAAAQGKETRITSYRAFNGTLLLFEIVTKIYENSLSDRKEPPK